MTGEEKLKQIRRICKIFGIKVVREQSPDVDFLWTGRELYMARAGEGNYTADIEFMLHEIGHFQVAAPYRRYRSDFGLGTLKKDDEPEEDLAKVLGVAWEIHLGRDIHSALYNTGFQIKYIASEKRYAQLYSGVPPGSSWYTSPVELRRMAIARAWDTFCEFLYNAMMLQNGGYLTTKGKPTYQLNPGRPWTRTRKRSSKRSATSSRKRARRASTRRSARSRTLASAN